MSGPAPSCVKALEDAKTRWPNRNRSHDGIMGDPAHKKRKSDHNAGNAFDLTHDKANGVDCNELAESVMKDGRVKYIIWNAKIYSVAKAKEGWREYKGRNKHTKHMHVSIDANKRDDLSAWPWTPPLLTKPAYVGPPLKLGKWGTRVFLIQERLYELGYDIAPDLDFGRKTKKLVESFQKNNKLTVDGIVGKQTWDMLWSPWADRLLIDPVSWQGHRVC